MTGSPASSGIADCLNAQTESAARESLLRSCGSERWVAEMLALRPYPSDRSLLESAERIWWSLDPKDWLEAAAQHPRIGERAPTGSSTEAWAQQEQSGMAEASSDLTQELANLNHVYEEKFGFVFLICATGLSAEAMLAAIRGRIDNMADDELTHLATEKAKILRLRLQKLVRE